MKKKKYISAFLLAAMTFAAAAQSPAVAPEQKKAIMLSGGVVHTGTGEVIENGIVAFDKGTITVVSKATDVIIDKGKYEVIDVSGKHVYPGLIFPNTSVGLVEIGGGVEVTDDAQETGDLNPNVRAIAAYNTDSHVIPVLRSNGILLAQIVPRGTLLPGTSSVVQLDAWNWEDAAYSIDNGIQLGWPRKTMGRGRQMYAQMSTSMQNNYDKNVEALEKIFTDAEAYASIEKPEHVNLRLESMKGLFDGTRILYITSSEPKGIVAAISFAKRHGVKKMVLSGADENAWIEREFIKSNNVPVILSNPLSLPMYESSDIRMPFKLAAMFKNEGILAGLTYSSQAYPNLPFAAGQTVAYGLTREEALQTITINNAKILGIDNRTGSIEKGKDANIVVSTGDILDMAGNNVELAFIKGRNISLDNKHKQLYRRFQSKYDNMEQEKAGKGKILKQPSGVDK